MARKPDFMFITVLGITNCPGCALTPDEQSLVFTHGDEVRRATVDGGLSVPIAGSFFGSGFADGPAAAAQFNWPRGVVIGEDGSVFVADNGNHRIRLIKDDVVTTFAGSGEEGDADGVGAAAQFYYPGGLALGPGGVLYVTDGNHRIRMISPAGAVTTLAGAVTTLAGAAGFADGRGTAARFDQPMGIAVDAAGVVFVADCHNHRIRRITNGVVDTLAGSGAHGFADGVGAAAQFHDPMGLALDPTTGNLLVTDVRNRRIRSVDPRTGTVTTLPIGGGAARPTPLIDAATIDIPPESLWAITVGRNGTLYVGFDEGIMRLDNVRRIREQARDVKNALLGNLFIDRDRVMDPAKEAAVSRHAARVAHPLRSGDDAVSRSTESGIITANIGKFLVGETAEPERGQLTNPHTLLTHLRNQHDGRVPVGSRFTAPPPPPPPPPAAAPPPPPPGGRGRKTRKHRSRHRRSRRQRR
jgi:DNA-binding beta-propeller fold protein YncE